MAKKLGSQRASSKSTQDTAGTTSTTDSRQAGEGGQSRGVYINERGQVCYGDQCVTLTIDQDRNEIVVNVKRDATCNVEPLIEAMRETLGKKSRTVYEIEND